MPLASLSLQFCSLFRSLSLRLLTAIQHFLTLSTHPLSLTLLPIRYVCCYSIATMPTRELNRFGIYHFPSGCTHGLVTVFPLPPLLGLFRCCLFAGFTMSMVCLLAGFARCTTLGVLWGKRDSNPQPNVHDVALPLSAYRLIATSPNMSI